MVWDYDGREEALHGEQCAFAGDTVIDDDLGELVAIRIDGGEIIVEVEGAERGKMVEMPYSFGTFRASSLWNGIANASAASRDGDDSVNAQRGERSEPRR